MQVKLTVFVKGEAVEQYYSELLNAAHIVFYSFLHVYQ